VPGFPNRCEYIKVNGTQCGSPALRRKQLCYFHQRHHEERVKLGADRAKRRRNVAIDLPVLEDANSIQVSLMQIMRLLVAGQLDGKTAGLLLYALQTASSNLGRTSFEPNMQNVILDPRTVSETPLGEHIWEESDFEEEDEPEVKRAKPNSAKSITAKAPAEQLTIAEVRERCKQQVIKALPAIQHAVEQKTGKPWWEIRA
jgi:hypothetical protein